MIAFLKNNMWVTKLLASMAAVLFLLVTAQRLAVRAYWETHPEEYLKSEAQAPLVEKTLAKLVVTQKEQRRKAEMQSEFLKNLEQMAALKGVHVLIPKVGSREAESLWEQQVSSAKAIVYPDGEPPVPPMLTDLRMLEENAADRLFGPPIPAKSN